MNFNMNNIIIVTNITNNICENVLTSHLHAANRWKCKYLLEHSSYSLMNTCYPSWNKIGVLFDIVYHKYDNILILDSDILIREDAPNPFHISHIDKFNVVRDSHYKFINDDKKLTTYIQDFITPHYEYLKKYDPTLNFTYIKNYFNSGMMIYCPKIFKQHINMSKYMEIITNSIANGSAHREQGIINYIVQKELTINFLPDTWNVVDPNINNPKMNDYMYHFTGKDWHGLKEKVKTYDWKYYKK